MDTAPPAAPNSADLGPGSFRSFRWWWRRPEGHPPALDRSVADSRTAPAVGTSDRRHAAQRHAAIDGAGCRHDGRDTLSVPRPRPAGHRGSRGAGAPSRTPSDARPRAWPSDTLTGGRVRRLARPAAPTTAAASPWPLAQTALERHRFRAAASGPWPPPHGGRTVRPQLAREAWSTGAAVAGAPWQTRRPPPPDPRIDPLVPILAARQPPHLLRQDPLGLRPRVTPIPPRRRVVHHLGAQPGLRPRERTTQSFPHRHSDPLSTGTEEIGPHHRPDAAPVGFDVPRPEEHHQARFPLPEPPRVSLAALAQVGRIFELPIRFVRVAVPLDGGRDLRDRQHTPLVR